MAEFLMPSLGADMETGKVVEWLVKPGDSVKSGDVVAVVETHKGAIEVEIFLDGVIDQLAPLDETLPVGAVLAQVAPDIQAPASAANVTPEANQASKNKENKETVKSRPGNVLQTSDEAVSAAHLTPNPRPHSTPHSTPHSETHPANIGRPAAAPATLAATTSRVRISPAARRRAAELGLDPGSLRGTGAQGAVTLADVEQAASGTPSPLPDNTEPQQKHRGIDTDQMRLAIATAMSRSKREIPHYYLSETIDLSSASQWLADWNAARPPEQRLLSAVLLLKASALALRAVPQLNGFFTDGAFQQGQGIHIGWAIALRGGGLVAPAIHDVDQKSLPELMHAMRDLVQRARAGRLRGSEMTDPTITITNLGDRGAESVLGVIYPPQVAIVGFGRILQRPWVFEGQIEARQMVNATLAADHRASDGHLGAQLLTALHRLLQSPQAL